MNKLWVLMLVIVLAVVSAAAGCSNNESNNEKPAPSNESAATNSPEPAQSESKPLSILVSHALTKYAMQATNDDKFIKELSRLSGFDLSYEILGHDDEFDQQLSIRFASGDLPDLIRTESIESPVHNQALEQGVFMELGDLIDKYGPNIKKNIPESVWKSPRVSRDGKIFAIPVLRPFKGTDILYIRQDWLDKLGMKQPATIDEYLAFFEAVKKEDVNGNGDPDDEYGLYVRETMSYADLWFAQFSKHPNFWTFSDGELKPNMINPEIKESIKFWKMLYDKGYINPNLFTNASKDWVAGILQGKAGMWQHELLNFNSTWNLSGFVDQPDAKLSFIKSPEGPKGHGLWGANDNIQYVFVIPAKSEHAENAIKFLDWAWSDEADNFFHYGIEGDTYTVEGGKVKWDPQSPANMENEASVFYQLVLNPRKDGRMDDGVVEYLADGERLRNGIDIAAYEVVPHDDVHMPEISVFQTRPELEPGTDAGSLFLEMFAKVVTGKADLDTEYDKFVKEWRERGGDEAIKEATAWYTKFNQN